MVLLVCTDLESGAGLVYACRLVPETNGSAIKKEVIFESRLVLDMTGGCEREV